MLAGPRERLGYGAGLLHHSLPKPDPPPSNSALPFPKMFPHCHLLCCPVQTLPFLVTRTVAAVSVPLHQCCLFTRCHNMPCSTFSTHSISTVSFSVHTVLRQNTWFSRLCFGVLACQHQFRIPSSKLIVCLNILAFISDVCKNCHHVIARHEYTFSVVDDYQVWTLITFNSLL